MQYGLGSFLWWHGTCVIVPNESAGSVVSCNMRQASNCKHVALIPILTMWLLSSNYAFPWDTKFLGVFSKTDTMQLQQSFPLNPRFSAEFSGKIRNFLGSLPEFLSALAFLCCHYMFDSISFISLSHILPGWFLALTLYMCTFIYLNCSFVFIVLNSNYFGRIQIYFNPVWMLFRA